MKIKYLSGPSAGEEAHVQTSVGKVIVACGLAEKLEDDNRLPKPGDAKPPAEKWSVIVRQGAQRAYLAVVLDIADTHFEYFGIPKNINACTTWDGGARFLSGFGRQVPESVAREYAQRWKENPQLRAFTDEEECKREHTEYLKARDEDWRKRGFVHER